MKAAKSAEIPEWLRLLIFTVAGIEIAIGVYSLFIAVTQWTSIPSSLVVILYFLVTLILAPLLAVWAIVLVWQNRNMQLAAILAAIPAAILVLRAWLIGGL
jgi:hypothetical protein